MASTPRTPRVAGSRFVAAHEPASSVDAPSTSSPAELRDERGSDTRLRVGLVLDSLVQPRWLSAMIDDITALDFVDIALIITTSHPESLEHQDGRQTGALKRIVANGRHLLYRLYTELDASRFSLQPDPLEPVDISPRVSGLPQLYANWWVLSGPAAENDPVIQEILAYNLDVALCLCSAPLERSTPKIARYGLWEYHHGDAEQYRGGPAGFWEVMEGNAVTGAVLQAVESSGRGEAVIYRSYSRTDKLSVRSNVSRGYSKSARFAGRKLRDLHKLGRHALEALPTPSGAADEAHPVRAEPTNAQMVSFLAKQAGRRIRNRMQKLTAFDQWTIAYQFTDAEPDPYNLFDGKPDRFTHVVPPKGLFWADPFPVFRNGRHYIFCEEYPYQRRKGHISVIELAPDGQPLPPVPVLDRPYHLAYPFIFEWEGTHYMIPETEHNKTIEMYRCVEFPFRWELAALLLDNISAVDTTLIEVDGQWWMFTNIAPPDAPDWDAELHLFHAPSPLGPWTPHMCNPVKSDVRNTRPAGSIFRFEGELYRPAQNCAERYGHSMTINQIVELSETAFEEIPIARILPDWAANLAGTHTINATDGLTVIDGLVRRSRYR